MEDSNVIRVSHQWWVHEAQQDTETFNLAVTAGLGSGKSHGACQWHHDRVLLNGRGFSGFATLTDQKIKDSLIPTYKKAIEGYGLIENLDYKIVLSPHPKLLYLENKHEVHFLSAAAARTLKAVQYTHATMSEAGSMNEAVLKGLNERVGREKGTVSQVLCEGVPEGINFYADWFDSLGVNKKQWEVLDGKHAQDFYHAELSRRRFRLTTYDNPFLNERYVENLIRTYQNNPSYIQCWIYGHFVQILKGTVYKGYSPERNLVEDIEPDPYLPIWISFDFNANPLAFIIAQEIREFDFLDLSRVKNLVVIHDSNAGASNINSAVSEISAILDPRLFRNADIRIVGDMSGHAGSHKSPTVGATDYTEVKRLLKLAGFNNVEIEANRSNPLETESAQQLNKALLSGYHKICKRCTNYIRSLVSTQWEDNKRKIKKGAKDDVTHWSDAGKYLVWKLTAPKGTIKAHV